MPNSGVADVSFLPPRILFVAWQISYPQSVKSCTNKAGCGLFRKLRRLSFNDAHPVDDYLNDTTILCVQTVRSAIPPCIVRETVAAVKLEKMQLQTNGPQLVGIGEFETTFRPS